MGASLWLLGAQTVMQAVGAHQEAKAQEKAYKAQAAAAEQNAAIEAKKAEQVAENYAKKQKQLTDRMRLVKGQALAAAGASGLSAGGSIADILGASQEAYEQDSLNLLSAQRNDTWSSYVNKVNYLNQAEAARVSAHNAREEGKAKIFSTLLGGAASIYGASAGTKSGASTGEWEKMGMDKIASTGNAYANVGGYGTDLVTGNYVGTSPYSAFKTKNKWTPDYANQLAFR